jgi:hypothetical protein
VGVTVAADRVDVDLNLDGELIPPDVVQTLFEVCGQRRLLRPGGDLGLAPVLGRQIARLMGGDAEVHKDTSGWSMVRISFRGH